MPTYTYVGSQQTYVVPGGVTLLQVECWGAQGQSAGQGTGGKGGYVKAIIPTTPGETLYVNVGGVGGWNGGGAPGGAHGGGMSDVRRGGTGTGFIVVVGGGGGAGATDDAANGGAGGNPGGAGTFDQNTTAMGLGGTQSAGGAAGSGSGGAGAGVAFVGGAGGGTQGGGGGGGYYGGGGGNNQGGGGGASWAEASAFSVSYATGSQASNGAVKLTIPAPPQPTLLTPYSGVALDASGAVALAWTYNPSASGTTQTSYQLRRKIGAGAYSYWNGSTWVGSAANNTTSAGTVSPTGWTNGNTYNWSIATTDANGLGAFANDFTFQASSAPSLSVTAPTGTATTDPVAHFAWTPTTPAGVQISYRGVVYNAAQYGAGGFAPGIGPSVWDSGTIGGTATALNSAVLVNGTYRAYVLLTETGGQFIWAYSAFVINTTPPTTPTLGGSSDPILSATILTAFASAGSLTASFQYSDDQVTWLPVRFGTSLPASGAGNSVSVYDEEAPAQATRYYRVMLQTALLVPSAWSATTSVISTVPGFWLKDLTGPLVSVRLKVLKGSFQTTYPEPLTEHQGLGRADAIIMADVMGLENGSFTGMALNITDNTPLMALLLVQRTLLLQHPDGRQWYVRITSARPTAQPYGTVAQYSDHSIAWRGQVRPL